MFTLDRVAILNHPRCQWVDDVVPIQQHLDTIEQYINVCYEQFPDTEIASSVVQHGRVIALRSTDGDRLSSAFKSSLYLGKYNDMANTSRFLTSMVASGHSYEPIRGESILFLFVGVGKPVYDHLITYSAGRTTRIAGGQRANVPWGFELPVEAKNADEYAPELERIRNVIRLAKQDRAEQMQAARSKLPVGYIMPPFLFEFSEEALIKHIFTQRLFEKGAQGATVDVVSDMLECCLAIDRVKWETLIDYHGPHIEQWKKVMRTLRKERPMLDDIVAIEGLDTVENARKYLKTVDVYGLLLRLYGKMPPSMWEKNR